MSEAANAAGGQLPLLAHHPVMPNPDRQRLNLLAISLVRGIGETSLKALLRSYNDLDKVWDHSPDEVWATLSRAGGRVPKASVARMLSMRERLAQDGERQLERLAQQGIRLITDTDSEYPNQLREIPDRPQWLFVQGDMTLLSQPNLVAVVGTRAPTDEGRERALLISRWLSQRGCGIVAGLAEGIDEVAHRTALDYGAPTVGVLGTGILVTFPASTADIRRAIVRGSGAVVTEYFPHESYSRARFVRRNRIQAGLSAATVPVEGAADSGTAHTYRFAKTFGRITFGVVRSTHPGGNGLLDLLRADSRPIVDLDSPESMAELDRLLPPAIATPRADRNVSVRFDSVLDEFERLARSYAVGDSEFQSLLERLRSRWDAIRNGAQGSRPRP